MTEDEYGVVSGIYDPLLDPLLAPLRRAVAAMARARGWTRMVDVGGGTGRQCQALAAAGVSCLLVDRSPGMLRVARGRRMALLDVLQGDAVCLPLAAAGADAVVFSLCLHEMPHHVRQAALAEAGRVGRMVVAADYALPESADWRGRAALLAAHLPERLAGRRHYAMFRDFLARGAAAGVLQAAGFEVLERASLFQGALAVILARPGRSQGAA
ncbi:class I SAM-dependent methyltransferase [Megalodesulfovibrio gigas]|uniref:Putative methyltransferase type 11 n=1 Tax=Megalodesulfovibrio gigas (strain ATCC 19364 / DSM 1382 / NCIMB 9332 / VKM B-1759) TaxID=1121448 RepID=T2GAZ9_MEGG1|nr:methyltransferase domain-containing protein [Megalodesulfovibrio gigas]AGW13760.1 putative methyltransferase type 11 [Megalodesulfovibrio gigas DSM 1382 = ATCC 19364]